MGCDQDVLRVGDGASALDTLSEHSGCGNMGDTWCLRVWAISQVYEVVQGSLQVLCDNDSIDTRTQT